MQNSSTHLIKLVTKDQKEIALWKMDSVKVSSKHIFLTHGTFSDKKIMLGIAAYFTNLGYTCWILEWRNHGSSSKTNEPFDMETIGLIDIETAFDYLINACKIKKIDCITHSGGGIALTMFLVKNIMYTHNINRIVMFNCQAFGSVQTKFDYLKLLLAKNITKIIGFVPGVQLGLGVQNEKYDTMKSWFEWNLTKSFKGNDGFDYLAKMKNIKTPILSICGGNDIIAPIEGCKKYLNAFGNLQNKLVHCSKSNGFKENYNHSRTILSKNASKEIWELAFEWINRI